LRQAGIPRWKSFANRPLLFHSARMTQPLALVCYEKLLPGSQLVNRLQDLGYRVQVLTSLETLIDEARSLRPMVALVDLAWQRTDPCEAIAALRAASDTGHIPVVAFVDPKRRKLQDAAVGAGATLVASYAGLLTQLPQLLEQALEVR